MADEQPTTSVLDKLPLEKLESYYDAGKNKYWTLTGERYTPFNKDDVIMRLADMGYSRSRAKSGLNACEKYIKGIQDGTLIDFAGEIAGHQPGFVEFDGKNFLVTSAPKPIEPVRGDWSTLKAIASNLVGQEQLPYFLGWHACSVKAFYTKSHQAGQVLVLAGPAGCGKSLWQTRVITPILGGRMAKPLQFMAGGTAFNEDIIRAEHLMLEDENSNMDIRSRRALGSAIKNFTVNKNQRVHGKGKTAVTVPSWHRMSVSVNDEPENLCVLPPQDESLKDKMMLIHCPNPFTYPAGLEGKQKELEAKITAEIPAFLWYLLNEHEIASELTSERYGVVAYANPIILEALSGLAPETELLNMIDEIMFPEGQTHAVRNNITAAEIQTLLLGNDITKYRATKIFTHANACGMLLGRLANCKPDRVERGTNWCNRGWRWKVRPPE